MTRTLLAVALQLLLGVAYAAASNWTPTVDTFGSSRAQYLSRDQWECRELAMQASGSSSGSAARGALRGGAVGAAGGAAVGAAFGNAGRGALVGGTVGGVGRGVQQHSASDAAFRRTFSNCLRARGHNVIG